MKKGTMFILLLVVCITLTSISVFAWSTYTTDEYSPEGYAGSFMYTPIRNVSYSNSGTFYLYRNQIDTQFSLGTANMPSGFYRYTDRGAYAFTDSVANPSNPNSYIIAQSKYAIFVIDHDHSDDYRPVNWYVSSMQNQLVETSGTAHLRLRFMFDVFGLDTQTWFCDKIFKFQYTITI